MADEVGRIVWFTGLSGAGKSTLAGAVAEHLRGSGRCVDMIDGDDLRQKLSSGLGFSRRDRAENARRAACLALELARRSDFVLVALITPYQAVREEIAQMLPSYLEVFVNAPLEVCEARDPKGLYRKARSGELSHFTGIDDPYEPPQCPSVEVRTDRDSIQACASDVLKALSRETNQVQRTRDMLRVALNADPGISMSEFSGCMRASTRKIAALLHTAGTSFRDIRRETLLATAQQLFKQGCSVKEVAFALKFSSPESFERFFRRAAGRRPNRSREVRSW